VLVLRKGYRVLPEVEVSSEMKIQANEDGNDKEDQIE
jgi:hypothetical protein